MAGVWDRLSPAITEHLGEAVTYTPKGQTAVSVTAFVRRGPLVARASEDRQRIDYELVVLVPQATIASVNVGGDTVALPRRVGDSATVTYRVSKIVGQDGGFWVLGLI